MHACAECRVFLSAGKIQELRAELNSDRKDAKHSKKKTVMKKIVANMTMGNDMSPLFPDIINVMNVPILEIKKMVYLYLINYARSKPDMAISAIPTFMKVPTVFRAAHPTSPVTPVCHAYRVRTRRMLKTRTL